MMRSFRRSSIRYFKDRLLEYAYQRQHSDLPWLTKTANEILGTYPLPTDRGVEFGSGRSTVSLARRINDIVSVEQNGSWYDRVRGRFTERELCNMAYRFGAAGVLEAAGACVGWFGGRLPIAAVRRYP